MTLVIDFFLIIGWELSYGLLEHLDCARLNSVVILAHVFACYGSQKPTSS